jgi:hypothetical protein
VRSLLDERATFHHNTSAHHREDWQPMQRVAEIRRPFLGHAMIMPEFEGDPP